MQVTYIFADGTIEKVEVDSTLGAVIRLYDNREKRYLEKANERHSSLDWLEEQGFELESDESGALENMVEQLDREEARAAIEAVRAAMEHLLPQQRALVQKVFYERRTVASIAQEEGVLECAIRDRLRKICKRLVKHL